MPGITGQAPDSQSLRRIKHSEDLDSPPAATLFNEPPPYSFRTTTTGYGVNEPQWSVGPPPIIFKLSPYARFPLPALPPVNLHPLLPCPDQKINNGQETLIYWSVNQPPSQACLSSTSIYANAYHWKALPAVSSHNPPLSSLTIRVASTPFTRPIVVFPSNIQTGLITIGDVLNAVYRGLRACANDILCESLHISPTLLSDQLFMKSVFPSLAHPTGDGTDEVSSHIAQILEFKTQWIGLVPSHGERDVFVLYTKSLSAS